MAASSKKKKSVSTATYEWRPSEEYTKTYTSYSGHDMVCTFSMPLENGGSISKVVGNVQTISYSIHNEKMPVRVLGNMNMRSVVFGNRMIAGSMVFIVFDRHWANYFMDEYLKSVKSNAHMLTDEMPPINITISMANEYGDRSSLVLYGVTFVNEGQNMSTNDMYTENTFEYFAKDIDYLTSQGFDRTPLKNPNFGKHISLKSGDDSKEDAPIDSPISPNKRKNDKNSDSTSNFSDTLHWSIGELTEDDYDHGRMHCLDKLLAQANTAMDTVKEFYDKDKISNTEFESQKKRIRETYRNAVNTINERFSIIEKTYV